MSPTIVLCSHKPMVALYEGILHQAGHDGVKIVFDGDEAQRLVDRVGQDAVMIGYCPGSEYTDDCMCERFAGYDRLRLLVATEGEPRECPMTSDTTVPHYRGGSVEDITDWVERQ